MKNLKIAIIGSGTSGLSAAAFLTNDGHEVTIFEKFKSPKPMGAGLLLQPTGLACLARLGLDEQAIQYGTKVNHLHGQSATGKTIFDVSYHLLAKHLFGLGIHRGSLFSILYDEVKRLNITIIANCDIQKSIVENRQSIISDANGHQFGPFDLVIDASGMRSALRKNMVN